MYSAVCRVSYPLLFGNYYYKHKKNIVIFSVSRDCNNERTLKQAAEMKHAEMSVYILIRVYSTAKVGIKIHGLNNYSCFISAACFSAYLLQSLLIVSSSRPIPHTHQKGSGEHPHPVLFSLSPKTGEC